MDFIGAVEAYYRKHYYSLEQGKQFHFASRLATWDCDSGARELLKDKLDYLLPSGDTGQAHSILQELLAKTPRSVSIEKHLREPYFQKYPSLYGLQRAIFRVRHLKYLYGLDIRKELYGLYPLRRIDALKNTLLTDANALRILSSHAVNFCFLADIVLHEKEPSFDAGIFLNAAKGYDSKDRSHIRLLIYLYTHCIISASNFYYQSIASQTRTYHEMLEQTEKMIRNNYDDVSLDNKLEFLVAARILGVIPQIASKIYSECSKSISSEGTFVIDKLNNVIQPHKQSLAQSEHRNTLLVLSSRPFRPCGKPVWAGPSAT